MNFYLDVIKNDRRFAVAARIADLNLLEPTTRLAVENICAAAAKLGKNLQVFETYRSQERQQQLFKQGATKLQKVGVHHYGLAADLVVYLNGEPTWRVDYSFLGPLAVKYGLVWGGDWGEPKVKHNFIDSDHVQRVAVVDQEKLFSGLWYPEVPNVTQA